MPDAAVQALAAGCDGLLICSGAADVQAAALEALVHAVEQDAVPVRRLEDALQRQRRAKERLLGAPVAVASARTLRQTLGCDAHRRVADEMARFL